MLLLQHSSVRLSLEVLLFYPTLLSLQYYQSVLEKQLKDEKKYELYLHVFQVGAI